MGPVPTMRVWPTSMKMTLVHQRLAQSGTGFAAPCGQGTSVEFENLEATPIRTALQSESLMETAPMRPPGWSSCCLDPGYLPL